MDPSDISGLPAWLQQTVNIGAFIGTILVAAWGYTRSKNAQPMPQETTAMVIGGSLGDRYAMDNLASAIREATESEKVCAALDKICGELERLREEFTDIRRYMTGPRRDT